MKEALLVGKHFFAGTVQLQPNPQTRCESGGLRPRRAFFFVPPAPRSTRPAEGI